MINNLPNSQINALYNYIMESIYELSEYTRFFNVMCHSTNENRFLSILKYIFNKFSSNIDKVLIQDENNASLKLFIKDIEDYIVELFKELDNVSSGIELEVKNVAVTFALENIFKTIEVFACWFLRAYYTANNNDEQTKIIEFTKQFIEEIEKRIEEAVTKEKEVIDKLRKNEDIQFILRKWKCEYNRMITEGFNSSEALDITGRIWYPRYHNIEQLS